MSKLRNYLWMTLGVFAIVFMAVPAWATPVSESFDTCAAHASYTSWTCDGFSVVNSILATNNACSGQIVRFNYNHSGTVPSPLPSLEYVGPGTQHGKDGGVGTIHFDYRSWGTYPTEPAVVNIYLSIGDAAYESIGYISTNITTCATWTYVVNTSRDSVKVKVEYAAGTARAERFMIDNFYIGDYVPDTTPPEVYSVALVNRTHLDVLFSEPVMQASSETVGNYVLNLGPTTPSGALRDVINIALVHLTFASNLPVGPDSITVNGVQDTSAQHNQAVNTKGYFTGSNAGAGDVVITEVMYQANSSPDSEWVEIHNTTGSSIDISGWVMIDGASYPGPGGEGELTVPASTTLGANSYLVLSRFVLPTIASSVVCAQAGSFSLSNSGDNLALYNAHSGGMVIDGSLTRNYPALGAAGSSIEKCNASLPWDSAAAAWHRSGNAFAATGPFLYCTPGSANTSCNDVIPPTLVSVNVVNLTTLDVTFSEAVQQGPAETVTNYSIDGLIGNPSLAVRQGILSIVRLTVSTLAYTTYTLTVNNILDIAGNPIVPNSTIQFTVQEPPDLIFTELMPNPRFVGLADSLGEWFEIYNSGSQMLDMSGWVIGDNSGRDTIEGTVHINPGQYFVFCSNGDSATNGGVPTNYAYHYGTSGWGLALNNTTADSLWLQDATFHSVIALKYTPSFKFAPGRSCQLRNLTDDFTQAANWCLADTTPWPGAWNHDAGTPGAATVCAANQNFTLCDIRTEDACGVPDLVGMYVSVTGVVTYADSCRRNAYIEDNGCAVMVYGPFVRNFMTGATRRMMEGDLVRVVTAVTQYNGLTEFSPVAGDSIVFISEGNAVPFPTEITAAEIAMRHATCDAEQYESRNVEIHNVRFLATGTFSAGTTGLNYDMETATHDTIQFRVVPCDTYLVGHVIPQGYLTLNGTLGQFKKVSCFCDSFQVGTGRIPAFVVQCATPLDVTAYKVGTDQVEVRWQPGENQSCNCYSIWYSDTQNGTYTLLDNVTGSTSYIDVTSPMPPLRFYKVTAGGQGCP